MQRVRIGIMGLAGVFLLVVLSAAVYSFFGNRPQTAAASSIGSVGNSAEAPREPLAELGVTPGNAPPEKDGPPSRPPQPAPGH